MNTSKVSGINIDISGIRNDKSPYSLLSKHEDQGFMPLDLYKKILVHLNNLNLLPENKIIALSVWGEPFLHPQINDILSVTARLGLHAHIRTNLLHLPDLTPTSLRIISGTTLMLSGFTQTSYNLIFDGYLQTALDNLNRYLQMIKQANCTWRPIIDWKSYRFNEIERKAANTYFNRLGLELMPTVGKPDDFGDMIRYFVHKDDTGDNRNKIEQELFTEFLAECIRRGQDPDYICPQWSRLALDTQANLLLCCAAPDPEMKNNGILGSLFDLSLDELTRIHTTGQDCQTCRSGGLAKMPEIQKTGFTIDSYLQVNPYHPTLEQIAETVTKSHTQKKRTFSKKNQPLVSIGVAAYNGGDFIGKTLESLLAQKYDHIEINITDDVSSDQTADICREYVNRDSRVHYYPNSNNIGARLNNLRSFELCQGEYFIWAADHDIYHPEFISTLLPIMIEDPQVVLTYPQTILIDTQDQPMLLIPDDTLETRGLEAPDRFKKILWELNSCNMFHTLYRAKALRQVHSFGKVIGSDHVLLAELSLYGSIAQVKEPLFFRRQNRPPETFQQQIERMRGKYSLSSSLDFTWLVPFCYWGYEHLQLVHNTKLPAETKEGLLQQVRQSMRSRWGRYIDQEIDHLATLVESKQITTGHSHLSSLYSLEFAHHINIANYFCADPQRQAALANLLHQILANQPVPSQSHAPIPQQTLASSPERIPTVEELIQQGTEFYQQNLFEKAEECFLQAQTFAPDNVNIAVSLGILYFDTHRFDQSQEQFIKAIQINSQDVDAWVGLGLIARQFGNQILLNQVIEQIKILQPAHPFLPRLQS